MEITITYCLLAETVSREMKLTPEQYYDPLEAGENYWDDGIERCVFPYRYLDFEPEEIKWVIARVSHEERVRYWRVQHLNGDKAMMQHVVDENAEEEIILSTLLPNGDWHSARILKPQGACWAVTRLAIDKDESGESKNLVANWSFDELKAFSKIGQPVDEANRLSDERQG